MSPGKHFSGSIFPCRETQASTAHRSGHCLVINTLPVGSQNSKLLFLQSVSLTESGRGSCRCRGKQASSPASTPCVPRTASLLLGGGQSGEGLRAGKGLPDVSQPCVALARSPKVRLTAEPGPLVGESVVTLERLLSLRLFYMWFPDIGPGLLAGHAGSLWRHQSSPHPFVVLFRGIQSLRDIVIYKKHRFSLHLRSWHRAPKLLGIP